mgnify:CR=1 FL=1
MERPVSRFVFILAVPSLAAAQGVTSSADPRATEAGREAEAKDSMTYEGSYTGRKEQKALAWIAEVTGMPLMKSTSE